MGTSGSTLQKTECFCFTPQTFAAAEQRALTVRFVVSPDLPQEVDRMTLAYSMYQVGMDQGWKGKRTTPNPNPYSLLSVADYLTRLLPMAHAHTAPDAGRYYVPHSSHWPIVGSISLFLVMVGAGPR